MLKRLIEVALPLKEVSEQAAREKSIRHGHISTLHIWWARRPLAACRAVVFASLIPDPDDPECPDSFRTLVNEVLGAGEFKPKNGDGSATKDTPRNRCLEFIKQLVRWENSNQPHYIEPARKLIAAAHKILHPNAEGDAPKVLDPFAGGGAIPLEALRLGCEAHAIDINPVAHLIELCTLVYPQKYGQPDSRPVPDYIKRLIANHRAKKKAKGQGDFFERGNGPSEHDGVLPDVEITEAEYRKNPLAADVTYWGHWVLGHVRQELSRFYPVDADGAVPVAYLWARTVACTNPACCASIPLVRQLWLCKKAKRKMALRLILNEKAKTCRFEVTEGKHIDFDPNLGTMQLGKAACPFCQTMVDGPKLRTESKAKRMGQQIMAVVVTSGIQKGKRYRAATETDEIVFTEATAALEEAKARFGVRIVPDEPMTPDRPSPNSRGLSGVVRYGLDDFGKLFSPRQLLCLTTFVRCIHRAVALLRLSNEPEYADAVGAYLGTVTDWFADKSTTLTRWHNSGEKISGTFSRQALPMVWDYAEVNPNSGVGADFCSGLDWTLRVVKNLSNVLSPGKAVRGSATALPYEQGSFAGVVTDPPYYDAVPYSDLGFTDKLRHTPTHRRQRMLGSATVACRFFSVFMAG